MYCRLLRQNSSREKLASVAWRSFGKVKIGAVPVEQIFALDILQKKNINGTQARHGDRPTIARIHVLPTYAVRCRRIPDVGDADRLRPAMSDWSLHGSG